MNKFKEVLKELRLEKGLTQEQLSAALNFSKKGISHYETGYSEPSLDILIKIAKYFNVSTDYLLGLEN